MASISLKYKSKQGNLTAPGDVDPGAMIPIATVTVGSGGSSTITFSSIPQGYEHLQIRGISGSTNSDYAASITFNSDTTGSNYRSHKLYGNGSTTTAGDGGNNPYSGVLGGGATTGMAGWVIDILDYANTNKYKTLRCLNGYDTNGAGYIWFNSELWMNTNAISNIVIASTGANFVQYSSFALYGIKRAGA